MEGPFLQLDDFTVTLIAKTLIPESVDDRSHEYAHSLANFAQTCKRMYGACGPLFAHFYSIVQQRKITNFRGKIVGPEWLIPFFKKKEADFAYFEGIFYFDRDGELHSTKDKPAIISVVNRLDWCGNGTREWFNHGQRHRPRKPAIVAATGFFEWFINGKYHREDGPASISFELEWFTYGKRHRDNVRGKLRPQTVHRSGYLEYCIDGENL